MKFEAGNIYVRYHTKLSLAAVGRKPSDVNQPNVINFPPKKGKLRNEPVGQVLQKKTSVLETPLRL